MSDTKKKIMLTDTILYVGANYIAQGLGVVNSIALRVFMGPTAMGIWSMLQVILGYCGYASFGVTKAMARDYPFLRGKGEYEEAEKLKDMTLTFTFLMSFIPVLAILVYLAIGWHSMEVTYRAGLIFLIFFLFVQRFNDLVVLLVRSDKKFSVLNQSIVLNAVGGLLITFLLVKVWKLYGLLAGTLIVTVGTLYFVLKRNPYKFNYYWNTKELLRELRLGIPLVASSFLATFLKNIDKMFIAKYLGFYSLGLYSLSIMASTYVLSFPMLFAHVWYPNLQEKYGITQSIDNIKNYLLTPVFVLSILVPLICFMAIYLIPVVAFLFMHKYLDGLVPMKIYLAGSFFLLLGQFASSFLVTIDKYLITVPILAISVVVNLLLNYLVLSMHWGINGVAASSVISFVLYGLLTYFAAIKHFSSKGDSYKSLLNSGFYFCFLTIGGYLIDHFIKWGGVYCSSLLKVVLFLAISTPFMLILNRETRLFSHLFGLISEKLNYLRLINRSKIIM